MFFSLLYYIVGYPDSQSQEQRPHNALDGRDMLQRTLNSGTGRCSICETTDPERRPFPTS
uniref:Uncharacterized protein n=1 Tax=Timema poppense TaxID=170557 RepID=A0A7R9D1Z8_TIMPO|nr:unnamed protein product [Timema poppensis]